MAGVSRYGVVVLGIALAGLLGLLTGRASVNVPSPSPQASRRRPARQPRESIDARRTTIIGGDPHLVDTWDEDGTLLLRRIDPGRVLLFDPEDALAAKDAIERFVGALRADLVTEQGEGRARINSMDVHWRLEGPAVEQTLRVVVIPADEFGWVGAAGELAQAIGEWTIVHDIYPETLQDDDGTLLCGAAVRAPIAEPKVPVFDAAEAEFEARGLTLRQDEVVHAMAVEVVRDKDGALLWSFAWSEDQDSGTFSIRHHADPFDKSGERALMKAILARAYGRKVRVSRR